uniref:Uncharacterized protein n=1 Tax=Oryza brachyantha TaxID=4533 RepID=J3LK17_ORYBR
PSHFSDRSLTRLLFPLQATCGSTRGRSMASCEVCADVVGCGHSPRRRTVHGLTGSQLITHTSEDLLSASN